MGLRIAPLLLLLLTASPVIPAGQGPNVVWVRQFGTSLYDHSPAVSVDGGGNTYGGGATYVALPGQVADPWHPSCTRRSAWRGGCVRPQVRQQGYRGVDASVRNIHHRWRRVRCSRPGWQRLRRWIHLWNFPWANLLWI